MWTYYRGEEGRVPGHPYEAHSHRGREMQGSTMVTDYKEAVVCAVLIVKPRNRIHLLNEHFLGLWCVLLTVSY